MFGKRSHTGLGTAPVADKASHSPVQAKTPTPAPVKTSSRASSEPSEEYYETKATIFNALFETIDVSALGGMQVDKAREEIRTIVDEIIIIRNVRLSDFEQSKLITEIRLCLLMAPHLQFVNLRRISSSSRIWLISNLSRLQVHVCWKLLGLANVTLLFLAVRVLVRRHSSTV